MIKIVEVLAIMLVAGGLALLAMGVVNFDQAMALIGAGIGLVGGKYIARVEDKVIKKLEEVLRR